MAIASIISYVALATGLSCSQVFIDTVIVLKKGRPIETRLLSELADTACQTDNPDLIWQVAAVESGFRFVLAGVNERGGSGLVLTGEEAAGYLRGLKKTKDKVNVDIGVLQINWASHASGFNFDPEAMVSPRRQVSYIVDKMVPGLVARCGRNWVGCYHSYLNGWRARHYLRKVDESGSKLNTIAMTVLRLRKSRGLAGGIGRGIGRGIGSAKSMPAYSALPARQCPASSEVRPATALYADVRPSAGATADLAVARKVFGIGQ